MGRVMRIENTAIPDVKMIHLDCHPDDRGLLIETYDSRAYAELGIDTVFDQGDQLRVRPIGRHRHQVVDSSKIWEQLGWQPRLSFEEGLRRTGTWYLANRSWWQLLYEGRHGRQCLGLKRMEKS